jgi:hypothetical protein
MYYFLLGLFQYWDGEGRRERGEKGRMTTCNSNVQVFSRDMYDGRYVLRPPKPTKFQLPLILLAYPHSGLVNFTSSGHGSWKMLSVCSLESHQTFSMTKSRHSDQCSKGFQASLNSRTCLIHAFKRLSKPLRTPFAFPTPEQLSSRHSRG